MGAPSTLARAGGGRQEWSAHWLLVLSAMAGYALGAIPSATLGVFMAPLEQELGWSRTEISFGLTLFAIVSLPLTPLVGLLVDKFGPRRIALPGVALSGLAFAAFGLLGAAFAQWVLLWITYTLASLLIRILVWNTAISGLFTASRGLAIAVLLCGGPLAQALSPLAARLLIDEVGWRGAYFAIGLGWGGIAFLLNQLFFREPRRPETPSSPEAGAPLRGGLTVREALRSRALQRISFAIFVQTTISVALMVHLVPMLVDGGLSPVAAASIASLRGVAALAGMLLTGTLVDRIAGDTLPFVTFVGPALAVLFFLFGAGSTVLLAIAVIVLGYFSASALQLATYLTTRYAGMRHFGTIFGLVSSLTALAAGLGPLIAGATFDATGSYTLLLALCVPAALAAGIAMFGLGAYPDFELRDESRRSSEE